MWPPDTGRLSRGRPAVWIDAAEDRALVGWLHWPNDASTSTLVAKINGEQVPLAVAIAGRPDVPSVIGVRSNVHAIRIEVDVVSWRLDQALDVEIAAGGTSLVVWKGSARQLVASMVARAWPIEVPEVVVKAALNGLRAPALAPGLANGAVTRAAATSRLPEMFTSGRRNIGPRFDLPVSPFQEHCYVRHVRDHPGYRTERHYPAATEAGTVEFLVWSLRSFAGNYPHAPLPLGECDRWLLNRPAMATGLPKGRVAGVLGEPLTLTVAQRFFVEHQHGKVEAADEDEMADWLLAWLGSWGWGHKGLGLMTPAQIEFLTESAHSYDAGTVGAVSQLNRFCCARLREHSAMRDRYPDLHLPHVRLAAMLQLIASELVDIGSDAIFGEELLSFVQDQEVQAVIMSTLTPKPRTMTTAQAVAPPASRPGQVRVLGMLESKSGLGQNARHSVKALRQAGIDAGSYAIAVNDRTVVAGANSSRSLAPANVNLWHLNPDNLPEAVCTVDPALYESSYNIGFFAWELDRQPRAHALAVDWVDEIWVPSEYCAASFRRITGKPVFVMPHALDIPDEIRPFSRQRLGIATDDFLVHCSFDMHSWPQRKNPIGAIRAFQLAFDDPHARLLLKIRNGKNIGVVDSDRDEIGAAVLELAEADERLLVDVLERSYAETLRLVAAADCHISLHRSEGFGYTLAESLALGVPLLCSDYSGSRDFCDDANSWLVPVTERFLLEGEYYLAPPGATWGEPDLDVAAQKLRRIRAGGDEVTARIDNGLTRSEQFRIENMSELYAQRIATILS